MLTLSEQRAALKDIAFNPKKDPILKVVACQEDLNYYLGAAEVALKTIPMMPKNLVDGKLQEAIRLLTLARAMRRKSEANKDKKAPRARHPKSNNQSVAD